MSKVTAIGNSNSRKSTPPPGIYNSGTPSEVDSMGEELSCPLCLETMDDSDCRFKPCPCGYQICRFCWHRIREEGNERCPACRRIYTDEDIEFLSTLSTTKKPNPNLQNKTSSVPTSLISGAIPSTTSTPVNTLSTGVLASRRHLVDIRVIQKNLVYVIGISARIAHEHILKEQEYFGQFGKIIKIVVNRRNTGTPLPAEKAALSGATTTSGSAYVTYTKTEEAARAINFVDGSVFDGRILRATYGTTKYCSYFLRGVSCPNPGCMYLHEEGDSDSSFTKEELSSGKLHLHSSLVDKTESVNLRQFGTVMYTKPLPPLATPARVVSPAPSSSIQPTSVIISNSASLPTSTTTNDDSSPPAYSLNLAEYEDQALSFLNRLRRWNQDVEFDLDTPPSPRVWSGSVFQDGNETSFFDPFSDTSIRKRTLSSNDDLIVSSSLQNTSPPSLGRFEMGPILTKGPLSGFEWNAANIVTKEPQVVTFRKPIQGSNPNTPGITGNRPAPVGSPIGAGSQWNYSSSSSPMTLKNTQFASPLPVQGAPTNLDHLFGYYSSSTASIPSKSTNDTGRKVLDASSLEKQFLQSTNESSAVGIKFNQVAAAPVSYSSSPSQANIPSHTINTSVNATNPSRSGSSNGNDLIAKRNEDQTVSEKSIIGRSEALNSGSTGNYPSVSHPKKPLPTVLTLSTKSSTATTPNSKFGLSSHQALMVKSNLFAVLGDDFGLDDEPESLNSTEVTKVDVAPDTVNNPPQAEILNNKILPLTTVKKNKKKDKSTNKKSFEESFARIAPHQPHPTLHGQPDYRLLWGTSDNAYSNPQQPRYNLMNDDERQAWRNWLEDDLKITKLEEQMLRSKLVKLHSEVSGWIKSYSSDSKVGIGAYAQ